MFPIFRTLRYLRPEQIVRRLGLRALRPWRESAFYARTCLPQLYPGDLNITPPALWPGDADAGRQIAAGHMRLLNLDHPTPNGPMDAWEPVRRSHLWLFTLHYFDWLDDLAAANDPSTARRLIGNWLDHYGGRVHRLAWHAYPLSLRLHAWLRHATFLLAGADERFKTRFLQALHQQAAHLPRVMETDIGGNHLIKNLKALITVSLCLEGHGHRLAPALDQLKRQLAIQVLPDGCHYERAPEYHVQVLCDLIDLQHLLWVWDTPAPWLDDAVARMAGAFRFFRRADGGLPLFNDGTVGNLALLNQVENLLPETEIPESLPDAGYFGINNGETSLILDAGLCGPDDLPGHAHADMLSFEMCDEAERLIVNSGTYAYQDQAWRNLLRGTAAHSTLSVDGHDSAEVYAAFRVGRRPRVVKAERRGHTITTRHDGYRHLGLTHERQLALAGANTLEGTDHLLASNGRIPPFTIRFHLHPSIRATNRDGNIALETPGGKRWLFTATDGPTPALEDGIYAPRFHMMEQSRRIAIHINDGICNQVRWRLTRVL